MFVINNGKKTYFSKVSRSTAAYSSHLFLGVGLVVVFACLLGASSVAAQSGLLSRPLTLRWKIDGLQSLAIAGEPATDRVYIVSTDGAVSAVQISDGELLWRSELGGRIAFDPLAVTNGVILASESDSPKPTASKPGQLRQLTSQGGITIWASLLPSPWTAPIASSPDALIGCGRDGKLVAVNRTNGRILWAADKSMQCTGAPVSDNDRVYVADERGEIVALDLLTGVPVWRYRTAGQRIKSLAIDESGLYAGSIDGAVYAFTSAAGNLRWSTRAGAGTQYLGATSEGVLLTSLDNYVYCLSNRKGKRRWKYRLDGRPLATPLIEGSSIFLLSLAGTEGIVLDLKTGKPINRLPLGPDFESAGNPLLLDSRLLVPTRQGLLAFAPSDDVPAPGASGRTH
jgi:outer membrane protein assembly factor BamB